MIVNSRPVTGSVPEYRIRGVRTPHARARAIAASSGIHCFSMVTGGWSTLRRTTAGPALVSTRLTRFTVPAASGSRSRTCRCSSRASAVEIPDRCRPASGSAREVASRLSSSAADRA